MYIVIRMFDDLQDVQVVGGIRTYHRYRQGDVYPREGMKPTSARIQELVSGRNALHRPLIAIPEERQADPVAENGAELAAEAATAAKKTAAAAERSAKAAERSAKAAEKAAKTTKSASKNRKPAAKGQARKTRGTSGKKAGS